MRIAAVYEPRLVNATYRALIPLAELGRRGHEVEGFPQRGDELSGSFDALTRFDVVHVHRLIVDDDDAFVERLHDAGVAVCFDNDDDAGAVTPEMWERLGDEVDPESIRRLIREHERAQALLPQMDVVTTPSSVLAERYRAAGARDVRVIENHLAREQLRIRPVAFDGFVVGWHGGREHLWDVDALAVDRVLLELLDAHPHVHVVTIGVDLRLDHNRYQHREWVELDELLDHVAGFDIGIAPLNDDPFSVGRSAVKLREYAAAGTPWVASAVGPYRDFGREQGGCVVERDGWLEALDRLVRSPMERMRLRRRARSWTKRELIESTADAWEDAFEDAVARVHAAV
ncbi:MAG TPA: glycosyltransferase [Conexibacter sp.]|nr:glycosyltransferase [Conexibacter sp.]